MTIYGSVSYTGLSIGHIFANFPIPYMGFDHESKAVAHIFGSNRLAIRVYYKELLQQLLFQFPDHFTSRYTKYSTKLTELINSSYPVTYELIEDKLKLRNRFDYYSLFKAYDIEFLSTDDAEFVEYIYLRRNNYVHNAGRLDTKTQEKLELTSLPFGEALISTEAKRLRTKLKRMIYKSHYRIIASLGNHSS